LYEPTGECARARDLFSEGVAHGILGFADFALNLPYHLFRGAFDFGSLIAGRLANGLFHSAFDLFASALNPILIHRLLLFIFGLLFAMRTAAMCQEHYHLVKQRSEQNCSHTALNFVLD
jgi:hypothetical protein